MKFLQYVDSEEVFNRNMNDPERRRLLELNNWTKDNITYTVNSHGFRSEEFRENGILFLGCSLTHGLGLALEDTWVYQVANKLNSHYANLGTPVYGGDGCYRLAREYIPKLKPKMVFYLSPSKNRFEIKLSTGKHQPISVELLHPLIVPKHKEIGIDKYIPFITDWFMEEENSQLNYEKNLIAIQSLCRDIPFYHLSTEDTLLPKDDTDLARDLQHPGRRWQRSIADKFIKML